MIWTKAFDDIPPRLQRMMLRLAPYGADVIYKPAKELMNCLPDTLSRAPSHNAQPELTENDYEQVAAVTLESASTLMSPDFVTLDDVASETAESNALSRIVNAVETGDWSGLPESLDCFFKERHDLTTLSTPRLLLRGNQIVIPSALRERLVKLAHDSHLGVKATLAQLNSVWWPGLSSDVKSAIDHCEICKEYEERTPDLELQPSGVLPPWHTVAADIFHVNRKPFLSVVDYGSRYPEVFPLRREQAPDVTDALEAIFCLRGPTCEIMTDNGPQFTSDEFKAFCKSWGVRIRHSAPRYARSNGMVERFHRTFKRRWHRCDDLDDKHRLRRVLFILRTTYHRTIGTSPLHALMGRKPITPIPALHEQKPVNRDHQLAAKAAMKVYHDSKKKIAPLVQPNVGERVTIRDGARLIRGEVKSVTPRRVQVTTEAGRDLVRTRAHVVTPARTHEQQTDELPHTRSGRVVKPPVRFDPSDPSTH